LEQQTTQVGERQVQIIMTSHSPNLASKALLENVILVRQGQTYHLGSEYTKLEKRDYRFLEIFLDVTKANLFFARGVLIVEGDAERILLPIIANLIGKPLDKYGVSIVNVGHTGLFRYTRIFQRKDNSLLDIKVACITDRDIPPVEAKGYLNDDRKTAAEFTAEEIIGLQEKKINRASGGSVKTFLSPTWTFEYDMCKQSADIALRFHQAIKLSIAADVSAERLTIEQENTVKEMAQKEFAQWQADHKAIDEISSLIYEPLYKKKASKVESAHYLAILLEEAYRLVEPEKNNALFPEYLVKAIDYVTDEN
jgi:putative ATP-dependent endonuclease of OLD family